jgi:hypothetical protein
MVACGSYVKRKKGRERQTKKKYDKGKETRGNEN